MKKLHYLVIALLCSVFGVAMLANNSYALANTSDTMAVLGLPNWYDNLPDDPDFTNSEEELEKYIWTIVVNIAGMILGVVGYIAVAFVVWGGFQYLLSSGDPGKAAKGKKTITNALIGSVICLLASTITGALSGIFGAMNGHSSDGDPTGFFAEIFNRAFIWGGILCVVMMVIGGISYVTSAGNPSKTTKAKNTIMYSAIGLIIILLAAAIVNFVLTAVKSGTAA